MGLLRNILFGSPEQRKRKAELKKAEQEAYYKAYRQARIAMARKRGLKAGRQGVGTGALSTVREGLRGAKLGAKRYMELFELEPKRKKKQDLW